MGALSETVTERQVSSPRSDSGDLAESTPSSSHEFSAGAQVSSRTAAHYTRNPLSIALGYAQLETMRGNIPPDVGERLVRSIAQAISGLDQLQDMLNSGGLRTRENGDTGPIFDLATQPWENRPMDPNSRFAISNRTKSPR